MLIDLRSALTGGCCFLLPLRSTGPRTCQRGCFMKIAICCAFVGISVLPLLLNAAPQQSESNSAAAASAIPGPIPGTRINEGYAGQMGRAIYAWGWPMVNVHNRKLIMEKVPEPGYMGGIVPMAPVNQLSMLHGYVEPAERMVACPNQDVAYGFGVIDLSQEPVVIQVPDF